jgi:hypothetical protein
MDAAFYKGGDPTLIAVSKKTILKDKYSNNDIKAAQLLSETLFGDYLNSLTGNEKDFAIKCLLDFVDGTCYMFFPTEKPEGLDDDIKEINELFEKKYTKSLEEGKIEDLSQVYEDILVPNFYLPAIKTAVRDKFLGEKISLNDKIEAIATVLAEQDYTINPDSLNDEEKYDTFLDEVKEKVKKLQESEDLYIK